MGGKVEKNDQVKLLMSGPILENLTLAVVYKVKKVVKF